MLTIVFATVFLLLLSAFGLVLFLLLKKKPGILSNEPPAPSAFATASADKPVFAAPDASLRDPVTALYNHKHLIRRLQEMTARADRENKKLAVILWDIDGFVQFNNEFGQKNGDMFLWKVGDAIRKTLRVYDEAFRSGPDEFCAILSPSDEGIAKEVAERVKGVVSNELFEGDAEYRGRKFSLSYGCVLYPGYYKLPEAILFAAQQELFKSQNVPVPELF